MSEIARVQDDPSMCWRYGWTVTPGVVVSVPLFLLIAVGSGESPMRLGEYLFWCVAGIAFFLVLAFGIGMYWRRRSAVVEYVVDEAGLRVLQAGQEVRFVARREIKSFQFDGKMDVSACYFGQFPPPSWPRGVIYRHGSGRALALPEIMIWGRLEMRAAEWELQKALRSTGPLQ